MAEQGPKEVGKFAIDLGDTDVLELVKDLFGKLKDPSKSTHQTQTIEFPLIPAIDEMLIAGDELPEDEDEDEHDEPQLESECDIAVTLQHVPRGNRWSRMGYFAIVKRSFINEPIGNRQLDITETFSFVNDNDPPFFHQKTFMFDGSRHVKRRGVPALEKLSPSQEAWAVLTGMKRQMQPKPLREMLFKDSSGGELADEHQLSELWWLLARGEYLLLPDEAEDSSTS